MTAPSPPPPAPVRSVCQSIRKSVYACFGAATVRDACGMPPRWWISEGLIARGRGAELWRPAFLGLRDGNARAEPWGNVPRRVRQKPTPKLWRRPARSACPRARCKPRPALGDTAPRRAPVRWGARGARGPFFEPTGLSPTFQPLSFTPRRRPHLAPPAAHPTVSAALTSSAAAPHGRVSWCGSWGPRRLASRSRRSSRPLAAGTDLAPPPRPRARARRAVRDAPLPAGPLLAGASSGRRRGPVGHHGSAVERPPHARPSSRPNTPSHAAPTQAPVLLPSRSLKWERAEPLGRWEQPWEGGTAGAPAASVCLSAGLCCARGCAQTRPCGAAARRVGWG